MKNILLTFFILISTLLNAQWNYLKFDKVNPDNKLFDAIYTKEGNGIWAKSTNIKDTNIYFSNNKGYDFIPVSFINVEDSLTVSLIEPINDSKIYLICREKVSRKLKLRFTMNAGKTWKSFIFNLGDTAFLENQIGGMSFYDTNHGSIWALADLKSQDKCKEIWNTADGGKTWSKVSCDSIKLYDGGKSDNIGIARANFGKTMYFDINKKYGKQNYMVISHNYGNSWTIRETNISGSEGNFYYPCFRDSLVGIVSYGSKFNLGVGLAFSSDGGRNWDTTFSMPDKDNAIIFKYFNNKANKDSGFWMGIYRNSKMNSGSFISFDDFKTIKKLDEIDHLNLFGYDTENIISGISEFNGNNVAIYPQRYKAGISQNISKNYAVYPNPFKNEITIKTEQIADVYLYNLEGKCMYSTSINIGENQLILNTKSHLYQNNIHIMNNELQSGIYILEIQSGNSIERIKLVKTE